MIFDFTKGFDDKPLEAAKQRPLVAISANVEQGCSSLHTAYSRAIEAAGGVPLIVPQGCDKAVLDEIIAHADALLLSGGADFDARYFGEQNIEGLTEYDSQRDYHEFMLFRAALDRALPVLGICRGMQLINIALGGDIYQDLPSQYPIKPLNHSVLDTERHVGVHEISIVQGSQLSQILGEEHLMVNSRHHQAIKSLAPTLRASAHSTDGVIEAIEGYAERKILGVQWHPENMATDGNSEQVKHLFNFFVGEARLYQRARRIHQRAPIIDSHCDTPMLYESSGFNLAQRNSIAKVDLIKMAEGALDATITVAYIPQSTPKEEANKKAINILNRFSEDLAKHPDQVIIAQHPDQVVAAKKKGLRSVMLAIENGLAIGDDLRSLELFKQMGVVYITLCHNGTNAICDSAAGERIHGGVSEFGRKTIERMNELGITIDVSHSSHEATMQAIELSRKPIIASHSSCKALCNHRRNLSNEAIRAIAAASGVVQVCGYGGFLALEREATLIDLAEHIEHVIELVGEDHVGVGSDFDGDGGVLGFDGANEFISLTVELLRRGHSESRIEKIMGGNILRLLSQNFR